jgi:hypothetical protein
MKAARANYPSHPRCINFYLVRTNWALRDRIRLGSLQSEHQLVALVNAGQLGNVRGDQLSGWSKKLESSLLVQYGRHVFTKVLQSLFYEHGHDIYLKKLIGT